MVSVMCSFVLTFILTFFVILVLWCSSPLLGLPPYSLSSVFWTLGSWKSFQVLLLEAAGIASSMLLGDSFGDETSANALFLLWTNSRFHCSNVCFGRLPLLNLSFTGQAQKPHQVKGKTSPRECLQHHSWRKLHDCRASQYAPNEKNGVQMGWSSSK